MKDTKKTPNAQWKSLCALCVLGVSLFCGGCAGTEFQGAVKTKYGKFAYDSKGAFAK